MPVKLISASTWGRTALALALAVSAPAPYCFAQPPGVAAKPADAARFLQELEALGPIDAEGYLKFDAAAYRAVTSKVLASAAADANPPATAEFAEVFLRVTRIEAQKSRVDDLLQSAYRKRSAIGSTDFGEHRDQALSNYLQRTLLLIDLSGRLNDHAATIARTAVLKASPQPAARTELLAYYDKTGSANGAIAFATQLVNPPARDPSRKALTTEEKLKVIELARRSGRREAIPLLTDVLNVAEDSPAVLLRIVEVLVELGVPQDPRPRQAADVPQPPVMAAEIIELLKYLPDVELNAQQKARKQTLLATYTGLAAKGLPKGSYRLGGFDVLPGDWILTYNPSPYNLFTNLSPGLYTHVGVAAEEVGADGKRRLVIVEVLEHDKVVLATNIDAYVEGVTRYAILRCDDPVAAAKMGRTANSIIGNPAEFDLTFQTQNVEQYKGRSLKGVKIKAYCAGVPLLCAQETGLPRETFFPVDEHPTGQYLAENLERLGMAIGDRFVTPTGPLFSSHMQLVGIKEPVYDSLKDIEERVFDHFARSIIERPLTPNPDLYQSLRLRMAKAAQGNPLLGQAIAAAAGVHSDTDLVAGAKAAAVVETLDEIAYAQSNAARDLLGALGPGTPEELARLGRTPQEIAAITAMRNRVPELWAAVSSGKMSRTALRAYLVDHYTKTGKAAIDARFFPPAGAAVQTPSKGK